MPALTPQEQADWERLRLEQLQSEIAYYAEFKHSVRSYQHCIVYIDRHDDDGSIKIAHIDADQNAYPEWSITPGDSRRIVVRLSQNDLRYGYAMHRALKQQEPLLAQYVCYEIDDPDPEAETWG